MGNEFGNCVSRRELLRRTEHRQMELGLVAPLVTDSVEPHMGSAEIEFVAHNPGDWFFHRDKPMHMEGEMIALVKIAGSRQGLGRAIGLIRDTLHPRKGRHIVTPWLVP